MTLPGVSRGFCCKEWWGIDRSVYFLSFLTFVKLVKSVEADKWRLRNDRFILYFDMIFYFLLTNSVFVAKNTTETSNSACFPSVVTEV